MEIRFQKTPGRPDLGIVFCWLLEIRTTQAERLEDYFIPELFFDYFFIQQGAVQRRAAAGAGPSSLPQQSIKTLFTSPIRLVYATPLRLFGARLSLSFAELFWGGDLPAGTFQEAGWIDGQPAGLDEFRERICRYIEKQREKRYPSRLLGSGLEETGWLRAYSARQKRRLYRATYGISRKEMLRIQGVHSFLAENCDFSGGNPRIIAHVDPQVFYDQPHLNRAFKKMTGLAPLEYFQVGSVLQDNLMAASYND